MSFELFNVFVIFQTKINKILRKLIDYLCVIYLDDILIYFKTKKKTLTNRKTNTDQITQIQIVRKFIQVCVYNSINKIFCHGLKSDGTYYSTLT